LWVHRINHDRSCPQAGADGLVGPRVAGDDPSMDDRGIAETLEHQSGVIARRQLHELGCAQHDIQRLIRRRTLTRIHPGVYVEHTGPMSWQQRAWAAVLALWPAALCGSSALRAVPDLDGPTADTALIHVAVDRGRRLRTPRGVQVHRMVRLDERVLWHIGPPRLRYEDAVVDVAARARSDYDALSVLAEACRGRRTTPQRLTTTLAQRPRVRRRAWLSAVLTDLAAGTTSVLEHGYRTRIEQAHDLPRAERQVRATGSNGIVYRDVEYAGGLVIELDGRIVHNTVSQRDADFERDLDAALDGRTTARLSWGQVFDRPCSTASTIARLLRQRGWTGTPRACTEGCPLDAEPVPRLIRRTG
jgi:hypothetical protein